MIKHVMRFFAGLLLVVAVAIGVLYVVAGRGGPPRITIDLPSRVVGQSGTFDATVETPPALTALTVALEQNGRTTPLFSLGGPSATVTRTDANHIRITRPFGKQN